MWRDFLRSLSVHLGFIPKPAFGLRFMDRHPTLDQVPDGQIVVVRGLEHHKWACLRCPGGCGNRLQLSLSPSRRPRWSIAADWLNRPSIEPSILQAGACGVHFWIERGNVRWCADSKCHPRH
jgi:Family of unknown function (DUF6527)